MSNTVINTNVMALNSHRALTNVGIRQARASERLSTGMRINRAADDAAGLAISEKMRAQIRGLDQAERNSQDGISLVQVAEGALQEIQDITQRMRELTVQAANDTLDVQDREAIQVELEQLAEEIATIIERTEFNGIPLLETNAPAAVDIFDLSQARQADIDRIIDFWIADVGAPTPVPRLNQTQLANALDAIMAAAQLPPNTDPPNADSNAARWNAIMASGAWDQTAVNLLTAEAISAGNGTVVAEWQEFVEGWTPTVIPAGTDIFDNSQLEPEDRDAIMNFWGDYSTFWDGDEDYLFNTLRGILNGGGVDYTGATDAGLWALIFNNDLWNEDANDALIAASYAVENTNVAATAWEAHENAFEQSRAVPPDMVNEIFIQNGANANQRLVLTLPNFNMLGDVGGPLVNLVNTFMDAEVPFEMGGHEDITVRLDDIDAALNEVSTYRAALGATQNRLEHTINNLQIASENTTAAESRIRDTDMAREMMAHTQANILQQAATSMLAQANQAPQAVLQLLQ